MEEILLYWWGGYFCQLQVKDLHQVKEIDRLSQHHVISSETGLLGEGFVFMQDNGPQNTSKLCQRYIKSKEDHVFVAASHQTRLDTRSKARRPIKVGIKGRGRSGTSRDSNPACLCCSSAHLVQCEPDEASSFTNPNVGPGTYASLRLKLDAWSSAVQRGQKCSSPTRRLPSRSWGAYSAPSLLLVSSTHPARMPDGPAKF